MKLSHPLDMDNAALINASFHATSDPSVDMKTSPPNGRFHFHTAAGEVGPRWWSAVDGKYLEMLREDYDESISGQWHFTGAGSPFLVDSTTKVDNLNADLLDGYDTALTATANTVAVRGTGGRLTVADPVADSDAATKGWVINVLNQIDRKESVRVATTADIDLSSMPSAIDGVTLANGERILVKDQSTASENGIYVFNGAASAATRSTDADEDAEVTTGLTTFVSEGSTHAGETYSLITPDTITVGSTALTFAVIASGGTSLSQGNGIVISGNVVHFASATSYTSGQTFYASGASTITALNIGAANTVMRTAGSVPSWGKVVLTTDVTGTLPVGNGGTGTGTTFTEGSVIYAGAGGVYSQDPNSFFWSASNNRLGIATNTPQKNLDVAGTATILTSLAIGQQDAAHTLDVAGTVRIISASAPQLRIVDGANEDGVYGAIVPNDAATKVSFYGYDLNDGGSAAYVKMWLGHSATANLVIDPVLTRVGVGTDSPSSKLAVRENTTATDTTPGISIEQAGTGDALLRFNLVGTMHWTVGIDNNDADKFKVQAATSLGASPALSLNPTNNRAGFNTDTASSALHVVENNSSTDTTTGLTLQNIGSGDSVVHFTAGANNYSMGIDASQTVFAMSITSTLSGGLLYLAATNRVGVGVVAPDDKFHVSGGNIRQEFTSATGLIQKNTAAASTANVTYISSLLNSSVSNKEAVRLRFSFADTVDASRTGLFEVRTANSADPTVTHFAVRGTKSGVNQANPTSTFHVYENTASTNSAAGLRIEQVGTGDAVLRFVAGVTTYSLGNDNSDADKLKISASTSLGATTGLCMADVNKWGMWTNSPTAAFHLVGQQRIDYAATSADILTLYNTSSVSASNMTRVLFNVNSDAQERTAARIQAGLTTVADASTVGEFSIWTRVPGALQRSMTIVGTDVGINQAVPTQQLHITNTDQDIFILLDAAGTTTDAGTILQNTNYSWTSGMDGTNNKYIIADGTDLSVPRISIDGSGNVTVHILGGGGTNTVVTHSAGTLQGRTINSGVWNTSATIWTNENDGDGSGLDADQLEGQEGSYYLNYGNFTGTIGGFTAARLIFADGSGNLSTSSVLKFDGTNVGMGGWSSPSVPLGVAGNTVISSGALFVQNNETPYAGSGKFGVYVNRTLVPVDTNHARAGYFELREDTGVSTTGTTRSIGVEVVNTYAGGSAAGTHQQFIGVLSQLGITNAVNIPVAYGYRSTFTSLNAGSSITNYYHYEATFNDKSTNQYGLYINNAASTDWAIYNPTDAKTYLKGQVGVGQSPETVPSATLTVYENSSITNQTCGVLIRQDGTGDAALHFETIGAYIWSIGIDNSDSDLFKVSRSTDLGTNDYFTIDTSGNINLPLLTASSILGLDGSNNIVSITDLPGGTTLGGKTIVRKFTQTLTGSNTSYTVTHNLGTTSINVQMRQTTTGDIYDARYDVLDGNSISVAFFEAPASGEFEVTVMG